MMLFAEPGQSTFHVREQFGRPQRAIVPNEGICGELMTEITQNYGIRGKHPVAFGRWPMPVPHW